MRSEGNAPRNGEQADAFSFTTMLQHTGRFRSRISKQRTMWQQWSFPLLSWCSSSVEGTSLLWC